MSFHARTLGPLPFNSNKKIQPKVDFNLDLSLNSLVVDIFGEDILDDTNKLEHIKIALIRLYYLDIKIDENSELLWDDDFEIEIKKAMHFFLTLIHSKEIGGIRYFDWKVIFDCRKRIYNMVKPCFYFE